MKHCDSCKGVFPISRQELPKTKLDAISTELSKQHLPNEALQGLRSLLASINKILNPWTHVVNHLWPQGSNTKDVYWPNVLNCGLLIWQCCHYRCIHARGRALKYVPFNTLPFTLIAICKILNYIQLTLTSHHTSKIPWASTNLLVSNNMSVIAITETAHLNSSL